MNRFFKEQDAKNFSRLLTKKGVLSHALSFKLLLKKF